MNTFIYKFLVFVSMKKIKVDYQKGIAKIKVENADDLWYLSQIMDRGDLVSGRTLRKLKLGGEEDRKKSIVKKPVFIKIQLDKTEFSESQISLRALGVIEEGPEDIPKGEHHTFNIEVGTELTIEKKFLNYQKDKLEESFDSQISNIIIVVFDREEAYFALMKKYGYEIISHIEGNVAKKDVETKNTQNFYLEIIKNLEEYEKRYNAMNMVVASPAFWKDELLKNLNNENLKKKIVFATCSSVTKSAINEILKRPEVKKVLVKDRTTKEINFVENLMQAISKNEKSAYGFKEVNESVNNGAVETLLVTDAFIQELRKDDDFEKLDNLMKTADKVKAGVHIISSKHEGGKKLDGLGGIGAILRY